MKIKTSDYRKYIEYIRARNKKYNDALIEKTIEDIKKRTLWNFYLGKSQEFAEQMIEEMIKWNKDYQQ